MASQVYAQAYDNPIPGYGTKNVANLRLFEATPVTEFDLDAFNEGQYEKAILQVTKLLQIYPGSEKDEKQTGTSYSKCDQGEIVDHCGFLADLVC